MIPFTQESISLRKNDTIFAQGQRVQAISTVQGSLDVYITVTEEKSGAKEGTADTAYRIFSLEPGTYIGIADFFQSAKYCFDYRAAEDVTVLSTNIQNLEQIKHFLDSYKEHTDSFILSLSALIDRSWTALIKAMNFTRQMDVLSNNLAVFFWLLKEKFELPFTPSSTFLTEGLMNLKKIKGAGLTLPYGFDAEFLEKDHSGIFRLHHAKSGVNRSRAEYYRHLSGLSTDVLRNFFGADPFITLYHCEDASRCLHEIQSGIREALLAANRYFKILYSENEESIFSAYAKLAAEAGSTSRDTSAMVQLLEYLTGKIKAFAAVYAKEYLQTSQDNVLYLESRYLEARKAASPSSGIAWPGEGMYTGAGESPESILSELRDSAKKILEYSSIPMERALLFLKNLEALRRLEDKFSQDAEARSLRTAITPLFFEIYAAVTKRSLEEKNDSRLIKMFLMFAYMDEKLLDEEQAIALYKLVNKLSVSTQFPVHNMQDWMASIYRMQKDPSVNELGQDYYDVFREMKRQGSVSDRDKAEYDNNADARLKFEVNNMLRVNQKLCYGQVSTYFPILHSGMLTRDPEKALVTPDRVRDSVNRILDVDFSAFHREISYRSADGSIEKELIMKQVVPDFLLLPTFGSRTMMWQELTGRNRSTPGRFMLPVFTAENLDELIVKLTGNFRWELCRTMAGVAWNDISQKSLTSEYTDYIQFFKKNPALHEEAKEKIKAQIQKHRSMMKDIFTSDYELWINYEAKGILRLNKVARGIMYRCCPLAKPIRNQFELQPAFSETAAQFNILRAKTARELENRYNKLVKAGTPFDEELKENLRFYKEL